MEFIAPAVHEIVANLSVSAYAPCHPAKKPNVAKITIVVIFFCVERIGREAMTCVMCMRRPKPLHASLPMRSISAWDCLFG